MAARRVVPPDLMAPGGAVADFQEAHQAARDATTGEHFGFAANLGKVRTGAAAIFEEPRLAHPQIHDSAFVDEVIGDGLDKAGVRLRALVSAVGLGDLVRMRIDVVMALGMAANRVRPVEAGVKPLRAVGCGHLGGEHEAQFVVEGARVLLIIKIAGFPGPIGPAAGEAAEDLAGILFAADAAVFRQFVQDVPVGLLTLQPPGDAFFLDRFRSGGDTRLAQILLGEDVYSHLGPGFRGQYVAGFKEDLPVRAGQAAGPGDKVEFLKGIDVLPGVAAIESQRSSSRSAVSRSVK